MASSDWYPKRQADLIPWSANFAARATATGTSLGLIATDVTQIGVDASAIAAVVNFQEAVTAFGQAVTEWKNSILEGDPLLPFPAVPAAPAAPSFVVGAKPGIEDRFRGFVARIKASPAYTTEIGELYGIIAPDSEDEGTPALKATALTQSQVQLAVTKAGYEVLAIDSKRGGGAWEQIGVSMTATYVDARPPLTPGQPEQREYRTQGMVQNARVGPLSDVVSAVTVP